MTAGISAAPSHPATRRQALVAITAAAFILLIPVLLNGFPFVFPDSGDYLVFTPHLYRSPYYGLFIFFFHWNRFIWATVVAQALIVGHLLWLTLALHGVRRLSPAAIALAALLCVFSSLPFFVGFIMADLFTAIMFIVMYLIGFHYAELSPPLRFYLILLGAVAMAAHVANLAMAIALLCPMTVLLFWCRIPRAEILKRLGILAVPIGLTTAAVLLFNIAIFGVLSLAPAAPDFLLANLIESGPARVYLDKACPQAGYKICAYAGRLPKTAEELLWSSGIFGKLGSFAGMREEARRIVAATLDRYPAEVARVTAAHFVAGLTAHEPAAEFRAANQVPSMTGLLRIKFGPRTANAYLASAEMRDTIPHALIRRIDDVAVPVFFFALVGLGLYAAWRGRRREASLATVVVCAVLGDTLLCTALSGVHDRYQARVTWLLPLAVFVIGFALATGAARKMTSERNLRESFSKRHSQGA
ncbi:MAG TPA: hypothetical protein VMV79_00905 [Alphaproteobacteria bacterium]|nr:hypothetical protein [Alphaproteobacteria bacterium]